MTVPCNSCSEVAEVVLSQLSNLKRGSNFQLVCVAIASHTFSNSARSAITCERSFLTKITLIKVWSIPHEAYRYRCCNIKMNDIAENEVRDTHTQNDFQCCIQKMWLGGGKLSFQNVGGAKVYTMYNVSKV